MNLVKYLLLTAAVFAVSAASVNAVESPVQGGAGLARDSNQNVAADIRESYFKRYPFARKAAECDQTTGISEQELSEKPGAKKNTESNPGGEDAEVKLQRAVGWPYEKVNGPDVTIYTQCVKQCEVCDHVCYAQPEISASNEVSSKRDLEVFNNLLTTNGLPLSDTQFQVIARENNQRFLELLMDPERPMWMATQLGLLQGAAVSNSVSHAAENTFQNAADSIRSNLINIANDREAASFKQGKAPESMNDSIAMIQQLYHQLFVPMAVLFLLPGAVLTQVRSNVLLGFFGFGGADVASPFEGILRSIIAIFLIPATQVIVSYSIDIGNSMADSVEPWINMKLITEWSVEQTYDPKEAKFKNEISPPEAKSGEGDKAANTSKSKGKQSMFGYLSDAFSGAIDFFRSFWNQVLSSLGLGGEGKAADTPEKDATLEDQSWLSQVLEASFNFTNYAFAEALVVLTAYQVAFMSYLFLLGPLAAAFFAWPELSKNLFRATFGNWLNAVTTLSMWRFYWCVILAVMSQRLVWLQRIGAYNASSEFEMMVFTCFMGMLLVVPFQPFNFDPGAIAEEVLKKGSSVGKGMAGGNAQAVVNSLKSHGAPENVVKAAEAKAQGISSGQSPFARVASQMSWASGTEGGTGRSDEKNGLGLLRDHASLIYGGEKDKKREAERKKLLPPVSSDNSNPPGATYRSAPPPISGQQETGAGRHTTGRATLPLTPGGSGANPVIASRAGFPARHLQMAQQALPMIVSLLQQGQPPPNVPAGGGRGQSPPPPMA